MEDKGYLFIKIIDLFLAILGLHCCASFSLAAVSRELLSSCGYLGSSLRWLLLLQSLGPRCNGFSSCGTWA